MKRGWTTAVTSMMVNQTRIAAWVFETFGPRVAADAKERVLRAVEEVVELAQAVGLEPPVIHRLVDYVFSRPAGKPDQEIAGSMVTLYAAAEALEVDADAVFEEELARIQRPEIIERCRRRQSEKREALVAAPTEAQDGMVDVSYDGRTQLPPAMVSELGNRIWFLRGRDRWEAWAEDALTATLNAPLNENASRR